MCVNIDVTSTHGRSVMLTLDKTALLINQRAQLKSSAHFIFQAAVTATFVPMIAYKGKRLRPEALLPVKLRRGLEIGLALTTGRGWPLAETVRMFNQSLIGGVGVWVDWTRIRCPSSLVAD